MVNWDYIEVVLNGLIQHRSYLTDYIFRESKKAESQFIDNLEFYNRLMEALDFFFTDIDKQYFERIKELAIIKQILEKNGEQTDVLLDQKTEKANYSVLLHSITHGKYRGHLWYADLVYFKKCATDALKKTILHNQKGKKDILINKFQNPRTETRDELKLSAFELALRHWYLDKAKIEPVGLNGKQVGELYKDLASQKNIQLFYNAIYSKKRQGNKKQLTNVKNSLKDYPQIQKAIENEIDILK